MKWRRGGKMIASERKIDWNLNERGNRRLERARLAFSYPKTICQSHSEDGKNMRKAQTQITRRKLKLRPGRRGRESLGLMMIGSFILWLVVTLRNSQVPGWRWKTPLSSEFLRAVFEHEWRLKLGDKLSHFNPFFHDFGEELCGGSVKLEVDQIMDLMENVSHLNDWIISWKVKKLPEVESTFPCFTFSSFIEAWKIHNNFSKQSKEIPRKFLEAQTHLRCLHVRGWVFTSPTSRGRLSTLITPITVETSSLLTFLGSPIVLTALKCGTSFTYSPQVGFSSQLSSVIALFYMTGYLAASFPAHPPPAVSSFPSHAFSSYLLIRKEKTKRNVFIVPHPVNGFSPWADHRGWGKA